LYRPHHNRRIRPYALLLCGEQAIQAENLRVRRHDEALESWAEGRPFRPLCYCPVGHGDTPHAREVQDEVDRTVLGYERVCSGIQGRDVVGPELPAKANQHDPLISIERKTEQTLLLLCNSSAPRMKRSHTPRIA